MKTQDEVAKSAEMCVIGAILIDEKALAAGDPDGLVAAELKQNLKHIGRERWKAREIELLVYL